MTAPAPTRDSVFAPGRRALTVGLVLTITLVAFEGLAVATVLPDIKSDLGDIALYGWVYSAFFLASLVGTVAAGRSADRGGPRRPFVMGLVLFAAGLVAGGLAPSMAVLVGARAVQGLGAGAIPAVAYVAIGRGYPIELQPRMFAVMSSAWVIPAVVGPAISGIVADEFSWRWVFLGLLPLVVIAGSITTGVLHALGAPGGGEPPDRRADALALAFGAALVLAGATSHAALIAPPCIIAGVLVGGRAFVRLMPPGTTQLAPGLPAAVALRGLATFAFFGTDAYVTLTLTSLHHTSTAIAGIAITAAALTWTAGAWVQERKVLTVGPQAFVRVGALIIAAGIGLMIVVALADVAVATAVLAWSIAGFGMGLSYAPLSLVVLAEAPEGGEGSASASLQLCDTLGVALGTGIAGAIVAAGPAFDWTAGTTLTIAFSMCIVIAIVTAATAGRLPAVPRRARSELGGSG